MLGELYMKNFQSVREARVDFRPYGVVAIVGDVDGDSEKSNGAGKSTVVDAILTAWFGKGRYDLFSSVKDDADEMHLEFTWYNTVGGEETKYKVVRDAKRSTRKHTRELYIGKSRTPFGGGKKETDRYIIDVLGTDLDTMIATNVFVQGKDDAFTAAKPGVRKNYLRTMLDTQIWDRAAVIISGKLKKVKEDLSLASGQRDAFAKELDQLSLTDFDKAMSEAKENLAKCLETTKYYAAEKKRYEAELASREAARESYTTLTKLIGTYADRLTAIDKEIPDIDKLKASCKEALTKIFNMKNERAGLALESEEDPQPLRLKQAEIIKSKAEIDAELTHLSSDLHREKMEVTKVETLGATCDKCGQGISDKYKSRQVEKSQLTINDYVLKQNELGSKAQGLNVALQEAQTAISAIEGQISRNNSRREKIAQLDGQIAQEPEYNNRIKAAQGTKLKLQQERGSADAARQQELQKLEALPAYDAEAVLGFKQSISSFEGKIEEADGIAGQYREYMGSLQQQQVNMAKLKETIRVLDEKTAPIREKIFDLSVLAEAYSSKGIPALIVDNAFPVIQETANSIMRELDPSRSIEFRSLKEKVKGGSEETLDIWIKNHTKGTERVFETYSGGEATFLNLAIRKALSDMGAKRKYHKLPFIFLDEVFAKLDIRSRQSVLKVINLLQREYKQIISISHTDLQSAFPSLIKAEKRDEDTVYVQ